MKWRVMVEVMGEDGAVTQHMISEGGRSAVGQAATLGMSLADLDALLEAANDRQARKVVTLLRALETYVAGQAELIIDYATARHRGEPISTATTESTVQRLLHRRMGANQQMRWSPRGAHRMLKVRTAVLNGTFAADHVAAAARCEGPPGLRRSLDGDGSLPYHGRERPG